MKEIIKAMKKQAKAAESTLELHKAPLKSIRFFFSN